MQTCRNNRRRAQRAAAIVAGAMITPPQWKGEPAVAADSSSSLCDMWAEKEVQSGGIKFTGIHHVAIICADLERSLEFYCGLLGACSVRIREIRRRSVVCAERLSTCRLR